MTLSYTQKTIQISSNKKIYFFSDAHLGNQAYYLEKAREEKLISFISKISKDADYIFILGDLFDFWFEYKTSIYKRYIRILSELMRFTDNKIQVHYLVGNHDFWMRNLFTKYFKFKLHFNPITMAYGENKYFIAHGDGLNPKDKGYLFIKKVFRSKLTIRLFSLLHPDLAWTIAHTFSKTSRKYTEQFSDSEIKELIKFAQEKINSDKFDGVILGHTHHPEVVKLEKGTYYNTGDWIDHFTYLEGSSGSLTLKNF